MIVAVGQGVLALESDQLIPFSGVGVASRTQDMSVTSWFLFVATFVATSGKVMQNMHPIVDAGLFVISGVMTCGDGRGYCLLGLDCTLDEEFLPDPQGHCRGLQNAFTPSAHFSCCKYKNLTGQDNFVYTMVDPAVSTLVNSYSESSTEKMNIENQNTGSNIKDATKHDADQGIKDANIIEEFHKHMEKVKLKNDDKEHKVPVSTNTNTMVTSTQDYESVAIESNEDSEEEEEDDDDEEEDEEDESDEKSENNDIKTIQLGGNSGDRDEKETNETDEYYDSNESNEKENKEKEPNKDTDHMKKVDIGYKTEENITTAIDTDSVVNNVKLFLGNNINKETQKPSKYNSKPIIQNNLIQSDTSNKEQNKVSNLDELKEQYPYQQQFTSEKLCMRSSNAPKCRTVWKFMHRQKTLCAGTMLDQMWMLTSASCLERLVQVGLKNITVESHKDWKINNVVAYENFKSEYNHTHHDIGLVRLMVPIQRSICVPCIPRLNQKFIGSECAAPFSSSSQRSSGSSLLCQGLSEAYHSHGDEMMSLACRNPSGTHHNISDWNSGNGIICRGYLAGLQTPVRTEQLVYLQINPYVKWIQETMKSTSISQKFQVDQHGS
ncbi:hypothetical protein M8J76_009656 [Diaphorina citri]|nr:hypothetical protein M8J75_008115 [Diaphorina citri]KAI5741022.1 hypothetical protein M8J76_009656 [Diaphorina citri]